MNPKKSPKLLKPHSLKLRCISAAHTSVICISFMRVCCSSCRQWRCFCLRLCCWRYHHCLQQQLSSRSPPSVVVHVRRRCTPCGHVRRHQISLLILHDKASNGQQSSNHHHLPPLTFNDTTGQSRASSRTFVAASPGTILRSRVWGNFS